MCMALYRDVLQSFAFDGLAKWGRNEADGRLFCTSSHATDVCGEQPKASGCHHLLGVAIARQTQWPHVGMRPAGVNIDPALKQMHCTCQWFNDLVLCLTQKWCDRHSVDS